jgi:RNA polymerase sigma-70 factor (ECF subfamily)
MTQPQSAITQPFESLYACYAPTIIRYLERLTGSYETAEDLAQETFLKASLHVVQMATLDNPSAWLFRIATNTAYDEFRRQRRRTTTPLTDIHTRTLVAAPPGLSFEDVDLLWAVAGRLPDHYRIPLLLQGYAGYPASDIAELLGWNLSTVKSRIRRARVAFQKLYDEGGDGSDRLLAARARRYAVARADDDAHLVRAVGAERDLAVR